MGLGTFAATYGWNWYDVLVIAALIYGVFAGVRNGFSGEVLLVIGLLMMVALAMSFYANAGVWLKEAFGLTIEMANLLGFVGIAVLVYIATVVVKLVVHRKMKQLRFAAVVENFGGGVAGLLRMFVCMALLTVVLALSPSAFWHEQAARNSRFGVFVVQQFPAVAEVAKKEFPEKAWFLKDVKRREEPTIEESGSQKKPEN